MTISCCVSTGCLLLGVAGIVAATQAVVSIICSTEFDERTWRIGGAAKAAVTAGADGCANSYWLSGMNARIHLRSD